jgi:N12 class adenine-specific DNA methylase/SAM-dependent methyltransferase
MYTITDALAEVVCSATPTQRWDANRQAIAVLKELKTSGDKATKEQLDILAKFNGWGAVPAVFDPKDDQVWANKAQTELKELLSGRAYKLAQESILNAHYTDPAIAGAMWGMVKKLGFNGGKILEPSCGTGYFLGTMPSEIYYRSEVVGVELDPTAAEIAGHLYPEATIYPQAFESVSFPDHYFDLAIGNVPFGNYGVSDPRYDALKLSIHNYFIARLADLVRPGGYILLITSPYTLDSKSHKFREWLGDRVRLQQAIRLPAGAFKGVANTMVSPDILLLQKLGDGIEPNTDKWVDIHNFYYVERNWKDGGSYQGHELAVNYWYLDELRNRRDRVYSSPHKCLGIPAVNEMYGGGGFTLVSDGRDLVAAIAEVEIDCTYTPSKTKVQAGLLHPDLQGIKNHSFCEYQGKIYQRVDTNLQFVDPENWERVRDFWKLRKTLDKVIDAQSSPKDLAAYQQALEVVYSYFLNKWGKVNSKINVATLGQDPNYYLVRTLEKVDGTKADIFTKRVCRQYSAPKLADNPIDALTHSLNTHGKLNLEFICEILGNPPLEKVTAYLADKNAIFYDPALSQWVLADQYLSGNVRAKLAEAKTANLSRNVAELEKVQPAFKLPDAPDEIRLACLEAMGVNLADLSEQEIADLLSRKFRVRLGTVWIKPELYRQFAIEVLKLNSLVKIKYLPSPAAAWVVDGRSSDTVMFGTNHLDSLEILTKGLNLQDPRVVIRKDDEIQPLESAQATEDARNKLKAMKQAFLEWLYQDRDRAVSLCLHYNQHINVMVERKFDAAWMQLPGSNPEIKLNTWQMNGVARIIENNATFLAWDVGTGKTFAMIAAAMECRRLGLAKKPMMVVLNGTEKQIEADWLRLYPMANLLVPKKLDAEGRKLFTAAIKTADFDGVILTHSQFFSLTLSKEYQIAFLEQEKEIVEKFLSENKRDRGCKKALTKMLKRVEKRIKDVQGSMRKDEHIDFEGLTDMLIIDEIAQMKNLSVMTKQYNIRGIPTNYSQRATDTYMKVIYILGNLLSDVAGQVKGKVVGATGTLVSNTMAEIFTWQRMFQLETLQEMGIDHFDPWTVQFGEAVTSAEISPEGRYKVRTRLKDFVNLRELKSLMGQVVDIVTAESIGASLHRPEPSFVDVIVPPSEAQMRFLRDAVKRAEAIESRLVDPQEDNMLKITTDLTKAALSMRLMGDAEESIDSKLHQCAWNVWKIWKSTKSVKGVQLIFCDFSTPKADRYNVYEYLKRLLIMMGIPAAEIEFIHDHNKGKRAKLFDRVNAGEVRILMGSTQKLGTGCNVHKGGLWAMHHVDAPWRPADIEQREGRGIRQGNGVGLDDQCPNPILKKVLVFRYITERLDALRWQTLEWKQGMTKKFMNGDEIDAIEDSGEVVYSYAQVKSLSTGNPLLIEQCNLRNEMNSLLMQKRSHDDRQENLKWNTQRWANRIGSLLSIMDRVEADIEALQSQPQKFSASFNGVEIEDRTKAGEAFLGVKAEIEEKGSAGWSQVICSYRGFDVIGKKSFAVRFLADIRGNHVYECPLKFGNKSYNVAFNPEHLFDSIDHLLDALPAFLQSCNEDLETARVEQLRCESISGQVFPEIERLNEVTTRLAEIDEIMKEQEAAIALDSDADEEESESEDGEEFWHKDDKSVTFISPMAEVVSTLQQRDTKPEWLQELESLVCDRQQVLAQAA